MSDEKKPLEAFITPGIPSAAAVPHLVPMTFGPDSTNETTHLELPMKTVTIFLDGLIKRPIDAREETMTKVPWVEPKSDLPEDARERLKAMDDEKLEDLIEWFDGSPHFTDLLAYAKAVLRGRVPLEDRIVCSRCAALYEGWTKNDDEWSNAVALRDGWKEVQYRCGDGRNFEDTDWKALCPSCPPTPEEKAEQKACRAYTSRIIKQMRKEDAERAKKAQS